MNSTVFMPLLTSGVIAIENQTDELQAPQVSRWKPTADAGQVSLTFPDASNWICSRGGGVFATVIVC
jgi:hypothetical protein